MDWERLEASLFLVQGNLEKQLYAFASMIIAN